MFDRPHLSSAANARLNFVNNDRNAILVRNLLETREEVLIWDHIAALALDWLHHERRDLVTRNGARNDPLL